MFVCRQRRRSARGSRVSDSHAGSAQCSSGCCTAAAAWAARLRRSPNTAGPETAAASTSPAFPNASQYFLTRFASHYVHLQSILFQRYLRFSLGSNFKYQLFCLFLFLSSRILSYSWLLISDYETESSFLLFFALCSPGDLLFLKLQWLISLHY